MSKIKIISLETEAGTRESLSIWMFFNPRLTAVVNRSGGITFVHMQRAPSAGDFILTLKHLTESTEII